MRLHLTGLTQCYGPTRALWGAGLALAAGEIHALLGENGAGKSTLARLIGGGERPDRGLMKLDGHPYAPRNPPEARRLGVAVVSQEPTLAEDLTVEENLLLGVEPCRFGLLQPRRGRGQARAALAEVLPEPAADDLAELAERDAFLETPVRTLSPAERQCVELARALRCHPKLLILDEPARALSRGESGPLFACLRRLARRGVAALYITHWLEEAFALCGAFTVLRDGQCVATGRMGDVTAAELERAMSGGSRENSGGISSAPSASPRRHGPPLLELHALQSAAMRHPVSLALREGEVFGLAGLEGAGQTELLRAIYGLDPTAGGGLDFRGERQPGARTRRRGMAFVGSRREAGLFPHLSVADNLTMPALSRFAPEIPRPSGAARRRGSLRTMGSGGLGAAALRGPSGMLDLREEPPAAQRTSAAPPPLCRLRGLVSPERQAFAALDWMEKLRIRARSPLQLCRELSGGTQQKLLLGRLFLQRASVHLLDEPTRGIDVATRREIHRWIAALAAEGRAVLWASSEPRELLAACDTIGVMRHGRLAETRPARDWTPAELAAAANPAPTVDGSPATAEGRESISDLDCRAGLGAPKVSAWRLQAQHLY